MWARGLSGLQKYLHSQRGKKKKITIWLHFLHCLLQSAWWLQSELSSSTSFTLSISTPGCREAWGMQLNVRMLCGSTGGTRVSDSTLSVSVLSSVSKEMVGCWAGIRLGDRLAVSVSLGFTAFLLDLETAERVSSVSIVWPELAIRGCSGAEASSEKRKHQEQSILKAVCTLI